MSRSREEEMARIARLAGLSLSKEEEEILFSDLARIVPYMERIAELDTSRAAEYETSVDEDVLREDEASESDLPSKILEQAPLAQDGMFTVPRAIE